MMIGLPAMVNPGDVKPSDVREVALLEDPDQRAEARR